MTFNEGMQIDTSGATTSGGSGRGIAIGGGVGGLVIVLLALFLGVDPGQVIPQQAPGPAQTQPGYDLAKCKTGADANKYVECRVVATGNSVDRVWENLLKGYTRPTMRLFRGRSTRAADRRPAMGPFYCPVDKTAYFDTDFSRCWSTNSVPAVDRWPRSMSWRTNTGTTCRTCWGCWAARSRGAQGATGNGVRTELQADCYAGIWAHYAAITKAARNRRHLSGTAERQGYCRRTVRRRVGGR